MTRLESNVSMHSPVASTISFETWADSYVWTVLSLAWTTCISLKTMFVSYLSCEAFPKPNSFPPLSQGKEMINSVSWLASPQMISVTACSLIHHNFFKTVICKSLKNLTCCARMIIYFLYLHTLLVLHSIYLARSCSYLLCQVYLWAIHRITRSIKVYMK